MSRISPLKQLIVRLKTHLESIFNQCPKKCKGIPKPANQAGKQIHGSRKHFSRQKQTEQIKFKDLDFANNGGVAITKMWYTTGIDWCENFRMSLRVVYHNSQHMPLKPYFNVKQVRVSVVAATHYVIYECQVNLWVSGDQCMRSIWYFQVECGGGVLVLSTLTSMTMTMMTFRLKEAALHAKATQPKYTTNHTLGPLFSLYWQNQRQKGPTKNNRKLNTCRLVRSTSKPGCAVTC